VGEARRRQSATQRFIAEYPDFFFCGGQNRSATREHMPPTSLFDNAHRPNGLVMPACDECNRSTSTADLTASMVSRWDYFSDDQSNLDHRKLAARVRKQAPELIEEWMQLTEPLEKEQAREHLRSYGVSVPADAGVVMVGPLTIRQLNLFAHKATLALYFHHFQRPLPIRGVIAGYWRTKEDFAPTGVPRFLLEILPSYGTLRQGKWSEHKTFEYRHALNETDGIFGCFARFRRGLFVTGFAIADRAVIPANEVEWVSPALPKVLLGTPRFQRKL
jgi:hypothetical protein